MIITVESARQDWMERLKRQAFELRTIAEVVADVEMRAELAAFADRLDAQMADLKAHDS